MILNKSLSTFKKIMAASVLVILLTVSIATPVSAAVHGSLTFWHGLNYTYKYTKGSTSSTATEDNMYFYGYIYYETGPNAGLYASFQSPIAYNTTYSQLKVYPGSVIGQSLFEYFVGGNRVHTSTAWMDFNFE